MKVSLNVDIPVLTMVYNGINQTDIVGLLPANSTQRIIWSTNPATPGGTFVDAQGNSQTFAPGDVFTKAGDNLFVIKVAVNITTTTSRIA